MENVTSAVSTVHSPFDHGTSSLATDLCNTDENSIVSIIDSAECARLIIESSRSASPKVDSLFPWLHGITPMNLFAVGFLKSRYRNRNVDELLRIPQISAGTLVVRCGDPDNENVSIRGSVDVSDLLAKSHRTSRHIGRFLDTDDQVEGLHLRNFIIQPAKFAQISDILVYASIAANCSATKCEEAKKEAFAMAELIRMAHMREGSKRRVYFYGGSLEALEDELGSGCGDMLLAGCAPQLSEPELSFEITPYVWETGMLRYEQIGILQMTLAAPITPHVFVGNCMNIAQIRLLDVSQAKSIVPPLSEQQQKIAPWRTLVMLVDSPIEPPAMAMLDNLIRQAQKGVGMDNFVQLKVPPLRELVSSELNYKTIACIISLCKFIYSRSAENDVLIASSDGYHVVSALAVIYTMYATGKSLGDTLLYLHLDCARPVSLNETEYEITTAMESVIASFSPKSSSRRAHELGAIPVSMIARHYAKDGGVSLYQWPGFRGWLREFPGAFPSRILDHLYLGSFEHANNPEMLRALGIKRLISVGETLDWLEYPILESEVKKHGFLEVLHIENLQDDGVDGLLPHLPACLELLENGEESSEPTLVHCRKGVSRSAAVCIAEVMRSKRWGLPQAYVHTRIHRLDVIIQPNLRLMYDLLKYEEQAPYLSGRTVDWPVLCREIARLNRDYLS